MQRRQQHPARRHIADLDQPFARREVNPRHPRHVEDEHRGAGCAFSLRLLQHALSATKEHCALKLQQCDRLTRAAQGALLLRWPADARAADRVAGDAPDRRDGHEGGEDDDRKQHANTHRHHQAEGQCRAHHRQDHQRIPRPPRPATPGAEGRGRQLHQPQHRPAQHARERGKGQQRDQRAGQQQDKASHAGPPELRRAATPARPPAGHTWHCQASGRHAPRRRATQHGKARAAQISVVIGSAAGDFAQRRRRRQRLDGSQQRQGRHGGQQPVKRQCRNRCCEGRRQPSRKNVRCRRDGDNGPGCHARQCKQMMQHPRRAEREQRGRKAR